MTEPMRECPDRAENGVIPARRYAWVLGVTWTVIVAASLIWNFGRQKQATLEVARAEARVAHEKDVIYRRWNAGHGGVYVPQSDRTPPNKYLGVPNREITGPDGTTFTLVNPAYMTRQVHEMTEGHLGVRGHITSLNPIRPENAPDPWEAEALRSFERGEKEISSLQPLDGEEYMRLMRPLVTEAGCLECHRAQGYEVGDIRGGMSVSVPMAPLRVIAQGQMFASAAGHGLLWVLGGGGVILGARRIEQRVSERNRAEGELRQHHNNLENLVAERTQALAGANVELRDAAYRAAEANQEAQFANRTKSEFLAKMSHELRTPLNSIIGFSEMMIDDTKDPPGAKRARRLEKVHRNSKNLLELINDILDISKIEADRLTLDCGEVDVSAVIRECAELIRPLVKNDRVELRWRVDEAAVGEFPWIGDAIRLRQIITNLLSNAAKFTESGHIELRAKTDAGSLVIEVEDTGIGIAEDHLSTVFGEFEQVDSSSTRRAGGTGLGLSICRKLCDLMDGQVIASSTLGAGSCFTVILPIREPGLARHDAGSLHGGNGTILFVGNETESRRVAQVVTASAPRIECVDNVTQAIDYCQKRRPVMMWLDPLWPDALRFLGELKTHRGTAGIPFGLLGMIESQCAFVAFDDCLVLPLGKDTLRRIVHGGRRADMLRCLLALEGSALNDDLCDMLAEFPDIEMMAANSSDQALVLAAENRFDAVLSDLTDANAQAFELAHRLRIALPGDAPRSVAVIPRECTPDQVATFQARFSSHLAMHGESFDHVMMQSFAAAASLATEHELEEVLS